LRSECITLQAYVSAFKAESQVVNSIKACPVVVHITPPSECGMPAYAVIFRMCKCFQYCTTLLNWTKQLVALCHTDTVPLAADTMPLTTDTVPLTTGTVPLTTGTVPLTTDLVH